MYVFIQGALPCRPLPGLPRPPTEIARCVYIYLFIHLFIYTYVFPGNI